MAHPRKVIRSHFKDRLLGGETACADRVFATMTPPVSIEDVLHREGPVMLVFARDEEIREADYPEGRTDGSVRRRLEVAIEVLAVQRGSDSVDDILDDIAEEIEALLEDWTIPGMPSAEILLKDTQIDVTDSAQRIFGGLFMTYEVKYNAAYRKDTSEGFLPDDVWASAQGDPAELLIDGPGNDP